MAKGESEPGRVNFIEDADEVARWKAAAKIEGLSLSAWIRRLCRLAVGQAPPQNEEKERKGGR